MEWDIRLKAYETINADGGIEFQGRLDEDLTITIDLGEHDLLDADVDTYIDWVH